MEPLAEVSPMKGEWIGISTEDLLDRTFPDGNAFFGDKYFEGLAYMTDWVGHDSSIFRAFRQSMIEHSTPFHSE